MSPKRRFPWPQLLFATGLVLITIALGINLAEEAGVIKAESVASKVTVTNPAPASTDNSISGSSLPVASINLTRAHDLTGCDAWIEIPGADISLPVMQATSDDPYHWLRRDYEGNRSIAGTPFIDARTSAIAYNTLVFGHHLTATGGMFSNIFDTYKQDEFDEKLADGATWTTADGAYHLTALCAMHVYETNQNVQRFDFSDDADFRRWLHDLVANSGAHANDTDTLIASAHHALLTCCCSETAPNQPWRCINVFIY